MDKKTAIILGAIIVAFLSLLGLTLLQKDSNHIANATQIFEASDATGGYEENIEGDPDAPVKLYEYGDYQCTACAPMNPYINQLSEEYGDNLAIVFRTTIMSYHQNGTAAAAAANAVAKQGYWKEFKDLLYTNQNDWYYSDAEQRQSQFEEYFLKVSDGKGDLAKFREDMSSEAVRKKIRFDEDLAKAAKVEFTPTFFVEDEFIDQRVDGLSTNDFLNLLREAIDKRLEEKGIKNNRKAKEEEKAKKDQAKDTSTTKDSQKK